MKFTPFRIALIYFLFAIFWILTTDIFLESIVDNVALLTQLQIMKGWFYVTFTAIALYFMMRSYELYIKKRQQDQENIEANLRVALKAANMGGWNYDVKNDRLYVSEKHQEILGLDVDDEPSIEKVLGVIFEEDFPITKKAVSDTLEKGRPFDVEYRIRKNGEVRWIHSVGTPVIKSKKVVRVNGVISDITSEKERQQKLYTERKRLEHIFDSIPIFINEIDKNMQIRNVNKFFLERLGFAKEDIVNENLMNQMAPNEEELKEALDHISNADGTWKDFDVQAKEGEILKTSWTTIKIAEDRFLGIGVDITERYKLEKSVKESQKRLEFATNSANVGLWEWHPQTGKVVINENWAQIVGYSLQELEPVSIQTWNRLVHPEDLEKFEETVEVYFAGKMDMYECEIRMRHKDGHWVWVLDRGKAVEWDEDEKPIRMVGTHVEISEQKENERLLREAQRVANMGTYVLNIETKEAKTSRILDEIFGMPKGETITLDIWEQLIHPDFKFVISDFEKAMEKGTQFEKEYKIIRREDRQERWIYEKADIEFDTFGNPEQIVGIMQDITTVKEYEEKLEREKNLFKITSNLMSDVAWDFDIQANKIWWSEGIEQHFGFNREDISGGIDFWANHIHPDDMERVISSIKHAIEGDETLWEEEYVFLAANGEERMVLDRGYLFRDEEGKATRMTGAIVDFTKERKSKELLRYQADLLEVISDAVVSCDKEFRIKSWNNAAEVIYGWQEEEVIGELITDILETEYVTSTLEKVTKIFLEEGDWSGEVNQYDKYGNKLNILTSVRLLTDEDGDVRGMVVVNRDITQLEQTQKRLLVEQKRFEYAVSVVSDAIWDANPNKGTVWWSEGFKTKFGYEIPPIEKGGQVWENAIHPDDRDRVLENMKKVEDSRGTSWSENYRLYRADGTIAYVLDQSFIIRDEDGNIRRIIGAMNDITAEKMMEEELRRSEEYYRLLFEQSPIPMWIYEPNTFRFELANRAAVEKYGYSKEEFRQITVFDLHPESEQVAIRQEAQRNLQQDQSGFDEWVHITKGGEEIIAEISGTYIYRGKDQKRLLIANDITRQRKAESQAVSAVVEGEERERKRIANELHDGLGQYLSAANMNLETVYEDIPKLSPSLKKTFENGLKMLAHAISETRSISQNLLPKSIQDYGLKLAVQSLINNMKSAHDLNFTLYQNFNNEDIPDKIQINLFRIIQESLSNAIRHSGAKSIHLQLNHSSGDLICTVEDDGKGFDLNNIQTPGLGLQSIKTRVAAMAGNFDIDSKAGKGTLLTIIIPIKSSANHG